MSTLSSLTTTEESFDKTVQRAHAALNLLAGALIPPTPPRFAVAYAHHLGAVPDLTLALTRLINHDRLNAESVDEFYHQFLATDPNQAELDAASRKIQSAVGEVAEQIGSSSVRHQSFADGLEGFAGALADGKATSGQAQALLSLTREIGQDHKQLHDRLGQTMRELDVLRTQLDRLEREARRDALTGIGNRAQFDRQLRAAVSRVKREHQPLCLMMIDIDHFKRFNDLYGHQMGDQVLKLVAHQLALVGGEKHQPARYGGEEFALIVAGEGLAEAKALAETLRRKVEGRKVVNRRTGETLGQVTLSVGVTDFRDGESAAELVHRADEAMYRAKAAGRNCVVVDERA
jgi:diguanylate cyclase